MKNQELDLKPGQVIGTTAHHLKQDKKKNPTVKLTRVQDQPVKTSNKYDNLESMES